MGGDGSDHQVSRLGREDGATSGEGISGAAGGGGYDDGIGPVKGDALPSQGDLYIDGPA